MNEKEVGSADPHLPDYYVAIGTSAGGLEALESFLKHMPSDSGLGFIVLQHLSPDFKSLMDELLSRYTVMPVKVAEDGMLMERNQVVLLPPKKHMMIAEGRLILVDRMNDNGTSFPIDIFFRSLAEDQHHRAIGVILSGTGSDGSRGVRAIKEVGGLVVVQNPDDAKFDGMPYNAVKTGVADYVLPVDEIPENIIRFVSHPLVSGSGTAILKSLEDNDVALHEIFSLLKESVAIDFAQYKSTTVIRRIERRITINGVQSLQDYYSLLLRNPRELQALGKDMLIGVTRFFRDEDAFAIIEAKVIPEILKTTPIGEPVRVWVAGCSTGEEAYSAAILFKEALEKRGENRSVKIFATDVDPDAIAEASAGVYALNAVEDINAERLDKYFTKTDDYLKINPDIRGMVIFATHNLTNDPPFSNTQLTLCRNLLIYFQPKAQRRILSMLHFSLLKNGFLFLGSSETLGDLGSYFDIVDEKNRIYRKSVNARIINDALPSVGAEKAQRSAPLPLDQLIRNYQRSQGGTNNLTVLEQLVNDYVPACIVLNQDLEVQHVYGEVDNYTRKLKPGRFSAKVGDFILPELDIAVSTAVNRAISSEENVLYENVQFKQADGAIRTITLRARYIAGKPGAGCLIALIFADVGSPEKPADEDAVNFDISDQSQQRIRDLEQQLQKKHEHLQVTVEELETTNEELQSSNEELLAANEELQSTNEELQSVNEELYTVNSEYQEKIDELTRAHTDIDNILKSMDTGVIVLDDAMVIRKYSPAATRYVNLLPTDVGRPFHHISHSLIYGSFLDDIAKVMDSGSTIEREVNLVDGGSLVVNLTTYVDGADYPQGCVVSLTDISEIKSLKGQLYDSYLQLRQTIGTAFWSGKAAVQVLIVDDDPDDVFLLKSRLEGDITIGTEYTIHTANGFDEAKPLLEKGDVDICFIDYKLDQGTAFELIQQVSQKANQPAYILTSGYLEDSMYKPAVELGIYDVIDKAEISAQVLDRSIRYTLRHKETEKYLSRRTEAFQFQEEQADA